MQRVGVRHPRQQPRVGREGDDREPLDGQVPPESELGQLQFLEAYHSVNLGILTKYNVGVLSFVMFCFAFFQKVRLPIGLHSSCSISPAAGGTCQKCSTKHHE